MSYTSKLRTGVMPLFALVLLNNASAQKANTGSIIGTVTDASGAVLDNVQVTITNQDLNTNLETRTNKRGEYRFPLVPIGSYSLVVIAPGFAEEHHAKIEVNTGFTVDISASLKVASNNQTVNVTDEAQLVDTVNTNVLNNVNAEQLALLPNARDVGAVQGILPGTRVTTPDEGGSQTGNITSYSGYGISSNARTQLEGINTTEGRTSVGMYFDYGNFKQVSITTAGNDASMPVPGQFINLVLKSGTNDWHGSFYQDYESSSFQGTNISQKQVAQGLGSGSRTTEYYDTNGDFGGPILRNKLWFYSSIRHQKAGKTAPGFPVNDPTRYVDNYTKVEDISYKINWQISESQTFSHFLQWDRKYLPIRSGIMPSFSSSGNAALKNFYDDATYKTNLPSIATNVQYDKVFSPRLFLTARFGGWGYNSMNYRALPQGATPDYVRFDTTTLSVEGTPATFNFIRRRVQFDPNIIYYLDHFLHTSHQLKAGFLTEHETYRNQQPGSRDAVGLAYKSAAGAPDFTTPSTATLFNTHFDALNQQWHHGAYVQDQFRIGKRVTANVGVRWDYYNVYVEDQPLDKAAPYYNFFYGGQAISGVTIPASYTGGAVPGKMLVHLPFLITPRLGAAWDINGNGKTVLKASFGLFYGNPSPGDAGSATNPLQTTSYTFAWRGFDPSGTFNTSQLGAFQSNSGGATTTAAPHIKDALTQETTVFLERQLGNDFSVRAGYVLRQVRHDFQTVDVARTYNLYSVAKTVTDPGPDGIIGTSDDRKLTIYDLPSGGALPTSKFQYQTPDGNNSSYQNWEFGFNKRLSSRWSLFGNYFYTFNNYLLNGVPTNPNAALNNQVHSADWTSHVGGTYVVPKVKIQIVPLLRMQSGTNLGRTYSVPASSLNIGTTTVYVDPVGTYRSDSLFYADTRFQKELKFLSDRLRVDLNLDIFNIFNTNANTSQSAVTGVSNATVNGVRSSYQTFLSSTAITPPRILKLGGHFRF